MGIVTSKCCTQYRETCRELKAKIQILEEEIKEMKRAREQEACVYEQQAAALARKEDEWKRERKKHKEEVAKLRKRLEEEEDRMRGLQEEVAASRGDKEWNRAGTDYIVEHMKEERARREEAVEKWKQLYLAIKTELDDLIQRTRQGERFWWGVEEGMIEGLHQELKTKEETLQTLRSRIAAMEKEGIKRDREIDILRQSMRILSNTKRNRIRKNQPGSLRL
ncbi:golgin subfamily A member 6-like protein 6 [Phoenix dactylifera]|uniref:Golgin subfamily A member 6-like protein 6 n=1 Tax=Phoenix dactylifera TaxID=42345 RepID=A0A8B7BK11_PHODC|nr:golgin subfamily A member 6-like protein 6 [Phoenix dactylifera]